MNYKLIIPVAALAIGAGMLYTSGQVKAFGGFGGGRDTLIQALANKFGKSTDEVQSVFDEVRTQNQQQMEAKFEDNLNQAVSDGKITDEQKNLILQKQEELQTQHQQDFANGANLTPEERRTQRQQERAGLEKWASDNGIDLTYFHMGPGEGMGGRGGMRGGFGQEANQ